MLHCIGKEEPISNKRQFSVGQIAPKIENIYCNKGMQPNGGS
jgi:hypothetical protein